MEKQYGDLIILLASGINQRVMYFDNHPKVKSQCLEFKQRLLDFLETYQLERFSVGVFNGKFIKDGKYLVGPSIAGRSVIRFAERLKCGGFAFTLPLEVDQLTRFYRLAAEMTDELDNLEESRHLLEQKGLENIQLLRPFTEKEGEAGFADGDQQQDKPVGPDRNDLLPEDSLTVDFAPLLSVYQTLYETVGGNNKSVTEDARIDLDQARSNGEELVAVSDKGALDVMQFMRYPDYDSYTIGHSVRVAALAALISRELGWSREQRTEAATAGLLHDLGKGRIPEEILFKPAKLDQDERSIMETHPVQGARILLANGETSSAVLSAAWGHHLRQDGGGYPRPDQPSLPSTMASLIHICDVFEALTARRPYKLPFPPRMAFEMMLADQGAFAPALLGALFRTMGLYPPGSEVLLTDFRKAVVVAKGQDVKRPQIRITHEYGGLPLPPDAQEAIDLSREKELGIQEFLVVGIEAADSSELRGIKTTAH